MERWYGAIVEQNLTAVRLITLEKDFKAKGDSLLLNEYNGVGYDRYLKDSGSDSYFGTVAGNGGSWLELVVKENYLNLQRAEIKISENCREIFRGRFPELLTLAHLREGTIVTLSSEPTDMSYFPFAPEGNDWRLNINIDDLMDTSGIFKLSDKNISISILGWGWREGTTWHHLERVYGRECGRMIKEVYQILRGRSRSRGFLHLFGF